MLFFICDVWPLQLLINSPVFFNICGFSAERWFRYNIPIKIIILSLRRIHWKLKLWVVWLRNFESSNLTFDLQRSTQVENMFAVCPYHKFLSNFYWRFLSRSVLRRSSSKLQLRLSLYLVSFSRYSTSKFSGLGHDLWPPEVIWGQNYFHHSKAHTWFPI